MSSHEVALLAEEDTKEGPGGSIPAAVDTLGMHVDVDVKPIIPTA
jgi:hypothetical protein